MAVVTCEELEAKIRTQMLNVDYVKAVDLSDGCGAKFEVTVVSSSFEGKALLQQHRMVNKAIEEERPRIHALTLKTVLPQNWVGEA